ncbi:MAG: hypothetical protein U1D67_05050, partial [Dehalococcoidia bacterium]|nr:hypothetical protein [Dehalococcoidia bacterium]
LNLLAVAEENGESVVNLSSDVDGETWGSVCGRIKRAINNKLSSTNPSERRAVCLPMIRHRFNLPTCNQELAKVALDWAVEQKFLLPNKQGTVCSGRRRFNISEGFGLTAEDKENIAGWLKALAGEAEKVEPEKKPAVSVPPKPRVTNQRITAGEAWRGELGWFELWIPPVNGNKKGYTLYLKSLEGGHLFVDTADNGPADLESASIHISAIKDERGNVRPFLKLIPPPLSTDGLKKWQAQKERLGGVLQDGFRAVVHGQKDMDPRHFLITDVVGDSVLVFNGGFNWNPRNSEDQAVFSDLTLRFARRDDGQIALTEIVSPDAQDMLKEYLGQYRDPGQAFSLVKPLLCRVFLRAVYGQVVQGRSYE